MLEQGELWAAQSEFERAHALDPEFPGAHVGTALLAAEQEDFFRAKQEIELAIHRDNNFGDAFVARGRIATAEGVAREFDTEDWLQDALRAFRKASQLDPADLSVAYYEGMAYLAALDLDSARASLTQVLELNRGPYVTRALQQIERIQMIQRGSPGSELGLKIAMVGEITRAELAVLLLEELKLADLVRQRRALAPARDFVTPERYSRQTSPSVSDIESSWARPWIEEVLQLGIQGLELMPDGTFRPHQPITRANYARANGAIISLITGEAGMATRYVGESSRFPDVQGDSYAYNAIALNVARGIMAPEALTGRFRPDATVSGAEAILIIRQLQNAVRMEF